MGFPSPFSLCPSHSYSHVSELLLITSNARHMRPSIRNSDKEERAIFYQIMRCMQLPLARSDTLVGWTRRTRTQPERVALPIPSNIVLSSQFPVPCSFNPVRNRNRNPTQRTYNLSASNGNQTVTGRVSEKGDERERECHGNNNNNACNTNSN